MKNEPKIEPVSREIFESWKDHWQAVTESGKRKEVTYEEYLANPFELYYHIMPLGITYTDE